MKILESTLAHETSVSYIETDEGDFTLRMSYDHYTGDSYAEVFDSDGNVIPPSSETFKTIVNSLKR